MPWEGRICEGGLQSDLKKKKKSKTNSVDIPKICNCEYITYWLCLLQKGKEATQRQMYNWMKCKQENVTVQENCELQDILFLCMRENCMVVIPLLWKCINRPLTPGFSFFISGT